MSVEGYWSLHFCAAVRHPCHSFLFHHTLETDISSLIKHLASQTYSPENLDDGLRCNMEKQQGKDGETISKLLDSLLSYFQYCKH